MATTYAHPARNKRCAFCNRWAGNANLKYQNPATGFEYDVGVTGKCSKKGLATSNQIADKCEFYDPNMDARKLL